MGGRDGRRSVRGRGRRREPKAGRSLSAAPKGLRSALMRQAAEEMGQWVARHEERNAPVSLAELLKEGRERARQSALRRAREEAEAASND